LAYLQWITRKHENLIAALIEAMRIHSGGISIIAPSWSRLGRMRRRSSRSTEPLEPTMIKLTAIEPQTDTSLLLHFSDGSAGVFDFSSMLSNPTEMTSPLLDPAYFRRCFI
jgi:hypothetical protein